MASIAKKMKKGKAYYYAVECKRVDGKPRIVWQKYLGTINAIIDRSEAAQPPVPKECVIFEAGGVAALLRIAQRLGLEELISQHAPKRDQGPSVGQYIVLAAINRALAPCSKLAIGHWYEQTVLRRLWGFDPDAFSSQRFWDHMDRIPEKAIDVIQEQLIDRIQTQFGIDPRILLYDTTNFFTYIATTNDRAQLPQRGHNKQKRNDLRQVGLALLITQDYQIPLLHRVYTGNVTDVSLFPDLSRELLTRYKTLAATASQATIIFDKGNVCDEAMENLIVPGIHFVAALSAERIPQLLATPGTHLSDIEAMPGTKAFSMVQPLWGRDCQITLVYTESFFTQQLAGVTTNLVKCQKKLFDLSKALEKWRRGKARGTKPTVRSIERAVASVLSPQFMNQLFKTNVTLSDGLPILEYCVDHNALQRLCDQRLGRNLLATNRNEWTSRDTIAAYRSMSSIEDVFRNMKNTDFLHWQPTYHWTDQKISVHGLYCVLALLLTTLARKTAVQAGIDLSVPALLEELAEIREVAVIYPHGIASPKNHITLSRMSPRQRRLADTMQIAEALYAG